MAAIDAGTLTACHRVLSTAELLQQVLAYLPQLDLLTTTRQVCSYWKRTIETTPAIKWQSWTSYSLVQPQSLRSPSSPAPCFEINPIIFPQLQKLWKSIMEQQTPKGCFTDTSFLSPSAEWLAPFNNLPDYPIARPGLEKLTLRTQWTGKGGTWYDRRNPEPEDVEISCISTICTWKHLMKLLLQTMEDYCRQGFIIEDRPMERAVPYRVLLGLLTLGKAEDDLRDIKERSWTLVMVCLGDFRLEIVEGELECFASARG